MNKFSKLTDKNGILESHVHIDYHNPVTLQINLKTFLKNLLKLRKY